ncbi:hypothetical protein ACOSQ2_022086 [Xanthoceras sorbifolium]
MIDSPRHLCCTSPSVTTPRHLCHLATTPSLSSRHDAISHRRYSLAADSPHHLCCTSPSVIAVRRFAADSPHHLCCTSPSVIAVRRFTDHLGFTAESSRRGKLFVKLG